MHNTTSDIEVFKHFYWLYREELGHFEAHPRMLDWDATKKELMDATRRVQMGWTPHDTSRSKENCTHTEVAEHRVSIAHDGKRVEYTYCSLCGDTKPFYL